MMMKKKYYISLLALIIFILFGYWAKMQDWYKHLQINQPCSNLPPFEYLQINDVISVPEPGIILNDSFDTRSIISKWSNLWMKDEGKVTLGYGSNGINNSRCLLIKSKSTKSWAYSHNKYVEVLEGDVFSFEGFAELRGNKISAYVGIAAFDKHKKPIKWNYISEKVDKTEKWIKVKREFIIPDNIKYINFRLSGVGIGEFKFDNICFRKAGIRVGE